MPDTVAASHLSYTNHHTPSRVVTENLSLFAHKNAGFGGGKGSSMGTSVSLTNIEPPFSRSFEGEPCGVFNRSLRCGDSGGQSFACFLSCLRSRWRAMHG